MSEDSFWSNDEEFRDMPDEVSGKISEQPLAPKPQPRREPVAQATVPLEQFVDSLDDAADDDEEDDYTLILSDARLRLEQGKLYELIMNNDLFQDMEADPRAVKNVQREIKRFARERMEVMLGMRQEPTKESGIVSSPFNDLEVNILKKLASAASKGATETPEANKVAQVVAKKQSLTPIGGKSSVSKPKLATKPQAPIQRKAAAPAAEIVEEEYEPLSKPIHKMSSDELLERNRQAAARQAKNQSVKSKTALPQPTYDQEEMLYTQRAANASPAVSAIVAALNMSKK